MAETLIGLKALQVKLGKLDGAVGEKVLRSALLTASTPAMKAIKAAAPIGKKAHRTHKGNLVAPGFLRRSIKRTSRVKTGRNRTWASVSIGVKGEAFYGVLFVEKGTKAHTIKARRRTKSLVIGGRAVGKSVQHPGARAKPWFAKAFESKRSEMEQRFIQQLRAKIERAAR